MRYFVFVLALFGAACGGDSGNRNPVAPTPPPPTNIAGNWTGTFTYTPVNGGARTVVATTATFTQASNNITGQLNLTGGARIQMSGVVDSATLTSSVQYTGAPPSPCTGTASVSGSVSASLVRFTIPALATSGSCNFFTNGEFVFNRN